MDNPNEILYREFWVKTTRHNIRLLSLWLCDYVGEECFDKLDELKISKNDAKDILAYIELAKQYIPRDGAPINEVNLSRRIGLLVPKLTRKLNK